MRIDRTRIKPPTHLRRRCGLRSVGSLWTLPALAVAAVTSGAVHGVAAQSGVTAFTHANLVPMDAERILLDQTVVVRDGLIAEVGPTAGVTPPPEAQVIDAEGAYLMPGLSDMHAHLAQLGATREFLRVFLAAGTTTIRSLNALPEHLEWREEVRRGDLIGPTIYTSGRVIVGPPDRSLTWIFWAMQTLGVFAAGLLVWLALRASGQLNAPTRRVPRSPTLWAAGLAVLSALLIASHLIPINAYLSRQYPFAYFPDTEARARAEVRRQADAGYDVVKVYDYMTDDQYLGAIAEARDVGIHVVAHLDVGIDEAVGAGLRELAHVDELIDVHVAEEISPRDFRPVPFRYDRIPETVATLAENDVAVVANLTADANTVAFLEEGPDYFNRREYSVLSPQVLDELRAGRVVNWQPQLEWRRDVVMPFLLEATRQLHDAGVLLVTGTDTSEDTGSLPSHIHHELQMLVSAGLTPFEALQASTVNAQIVVARMGEAIPFGQVRPGQRADLVMLRANPLADLAATTERLGVMARGRWYPQSQLDSLVAELVGTY